MEKKKKTKARFLLGFVGRTESGVFCLKGEANRENRGHVFIIEDETLCHVKRSKRNDREA